MSTSVHLNDGGNKDYDGNENNDDDDNSNDGDDCYVFLPDWFSSIFVIRLEIIWLEAISLVLSMKILC